MAGVSSGQKRGPYSKRTPVEDLSALAGEMSSSLEHFLEKYSGEFVIALRKASRKMKLSEADRNYLDEYFG